VVVDNDEIADKLIRVMNKERSGRVTFIPLNKLKSDLPNYPKANDAIPMISKLRFDKRYNMAMNQVFGRTIICEDLATAAQYTRSHGLNAVTVEGDRADRKGTLTGGFHDVRRNRIDSAKLVKKWRETFETDSARHQEVKDGIRELEQKISHAMGQISVLDAKRRQILDRRGLNATQGNSTAREQEDMARRVARLDKLLDQAQAEYKDASAKRQSYEEELKTPMRQQLTDAELRTLEQLTKDQEAQKATLMKASTARAEVRHLFTSRSILTG
jgi:structural maintenance of chromosome 3 (chondroitin sulfate proteoglycan 6)